MSSSNSNTINESLSESPYISNNQNKSDEDSQNSKASIITNSIEMNYFENIDFTKLKELNSKCVKLIFENRVDISLEMLKKIESFLESNLLESKLEIDKKFLIIFLNNIACCYQKFKDQGNCLTYLEGVIYHYDKELEKKYKIEINEEYFLENFNKNQSNFSNLENLILEMRFCAKFHLQMCAVLSQADRHTDALKHAKLAGLICEDNIIKTYFLLSHLKSNGIYPFEEKNIEKNNNNQDDEEKEENENMEKIDLIQKIINDLYKKIIKLKNHCNIKDEKEKNNDLYYDTYLKYRKNEILKYQKNILLLNNIRFLLGYDIKQGNWLQLLNIGNIMYLSPLNYEDLEIESDIKYEISRDSILEKVIMFTVSYFCIAMEMKRLNPEKNDKKINGEYFNYQAVYFSELYLPISCPLVKHFINSYNKFYGRDLDVIPEGKVLDYKIDIIKNEIEINKDTQCFVRMQKMNYTGNNNSSEMIVSNINLNPKIHKDITTSDNYCIDINNNLSKRTKLSIGFKLNLNLENENRKKTYSNEGRSSHNKNEKFENNNFDDYLILKSENSLNNAAKKERKKMPKFKLNFEKLNEETKEKNFKGYNKIQIRQIIKRISIHNKTNDNLPSSRQKNKNNIKKVTNKKTLYKVAKNKSNLTSINKSETSLINKKVKTKRDDKKILKKFYDIINMIPKTARYTHKKKSPLKDNKSKGKDSLNKINKTNSRKKSKNSLGKKLYKNNNNNIQKIRPGNKNKKKLNLNLDIKRVSPNNIFQQIKISDIFISKHPKTKREQEKGLSDKNVNIIKHNKTSKNIATKPG